MTAPVVETLRSSPVKGLALTAVPALELVDGGIRGDRRFVLVDGDGRVRYGAELDGLARISATWEESSSTLSLHGPNGPIATAAVECDTETIRRATTSGRAVEGRRVHSPLAEVLSELAGETLWLLHVEPGHGGPGPITVLGDGSARRVAEAVGVPAIDPCRYRMSIELAGLEPHEEETWTGRAAAIGTAVIRFAGQVPRCVLMTKDPDTRRRDHDVLRAILGYRPRMATGEAPLGVYASVVEPGWISVGDGVRMLEA